ncbi:MAG: hypothetical protein WC222_01075 [Parachlamydiales bacterium]|jgi:hypothetical protein
MSGSIRAFLLALCILLAGCCKNTLELYTEFLGVEQYASYYIGTPDPALCNPDFGQMLVVKWDLPSEYLCYGRIHILVTLRYQSGKEEEIDLPLCKRSGTSSWKLMNENFLATGGIATYKAVLMSDSTPLSYWNQTLWNETISVGEGTDL